MLITKSVMVQMGSMMAQMRGVAADFRLYIHLYEFVATFLCTTKLLFLGGKIWVKEVFFWPTSHWRNRFIFVRSS